MACLEDQRTLHRPMNGDGPGPGPAQDIDQALAQIRAGKKPQGPPNEDIDSTLARIRGSGPPTKTPAEARVAANQVATGSPSPIAHIFNMAQGIPGMEAYEAASGALGLKIQNPKLPWGDAYRQSLQLLREETGKIGGGTRAVEKF